MAPRVQDRNKTRNQELETPISWLVAFMACAIALNVPGCSDDPDGDQSPNRLKLPKRPFRIGDPQQYRKRGVYTTHRRSHGVWIVSNGSMLVVLSAQCPHRGSGTLYDSVTDQFKCPHDGSRFTTDGINRTSSIASRPLERCHITLIGQRGDPASDLEIDAISKHRFRQERNEWSQRHSLFLFNES